MLKPDIAPLLNLGDSTIYSWIKKISEINLDESDKTQFEIYQKMTLNELKIEAQEVKRLK